VEKQPFTDDRIGSLLADVIRWKLNTKEVSFIQEGDYLCKITFTVKDEHILIGDNKVYKLKKDSGPQKYRPKLSKIDADMICEDILQRFLNSSSMDPTGVNMARAAIQSYVAA